MPTLNLDQLTEAGRVHNLTGKEHGVRARRDLQVERLDAINEPVEVIVPEHVYAISSSFFLGIFSESLQRFEGREGFLGHYRFKADQVIMEQIEEGIERWLTTQPAMARVA